MKRAGLVSWGIVVCLLYFWAAGLSGLDRYPVIYQDEAWYAAPGYTFWSRPRFGHFATDVFAGFYGAERHYYEFMPLLSLLAGAGLHLFGLGLFQARLVSLLLAVLTLALTYRLGADLFSRRHGLLAMLILAGWQIALPSPLMVSGIPLLDSARLVRPEILVAALGTGVLLLARRRRFWFFAGILAGWAALSHVYGAFWLAAAAAMGLGLGARSPRGYAALAGGFTLALLPWMLFAASGWRDFAGQTAHYAERFDLANPRFYLDNFGAEWRRYSPILDAARASIGAWLWLGLVAGGLLLLAWRALHSHPHRALLTALMTLCGLYALLLKLKTFAYLTALFPLLALTAAAAALWAWRWPRGRLVAGMLLALALAEGAAGLSHVRDTAARATPYRDFTARIASYLPPGRHVMGMQHYWPGLEARTASYRSILAPIFLTNRSYVEHPVSFAAAVEMAGQPDIILVDEILRYFLAEARDPSHPYHALGRQIAAYLRRGQVIAVLYDPTYGFIRIYAFE